MPHRHPPRRGCLTLTALEGRDVPATFGVFNANDAGFGSLRQAILDANALAGLDIIDFDAAFFNAANPRTITLLAASGQLTINQDLIIEGPGPAIVTVSGGGFVRPFSVDDANALTTINVTLSGMTVTGGNGTTDGTTAGDGGGIRTGNENLTLDNMVVTNNTASANNDGGGIALAQNAFLTVRNSTVSGNTGRRGGGIYFLGNGGLLMENSTISGNTSIGVTTGGGGGIYFFGTVAAGGFTIRNSTVAGNTTSGPGGGLSLIAVTGTARVQNSTFTGNVANTATTQSGFGGGGISVSGGGSAQPLTVESSIVSGNAAANGRSDLVTGNLLSVNLTFCAVGDPDGFTFTGSNNLPFGSALNLRPLANNGGPTQTVALGVGSLAVGAGSNPASLTTDQRGPGFPRQVGTAVDIGAFEGILDAPTASGGPFATVTTAGTTTYTFNVVYGGALPIDVTTLDNADIRVTGPNGFNQLAEFVSVTPSGNGSPRTATYRITGPGGTFDGSDNGTYTIGIEAGQVANTGGFTALPGAIGTFLVAVGQTFTVTNLNDSGAGSLRQAILDANVADGIADVIVFQTGLTGTITVAPTVGQLTITDSVTITGPGAGVLTVSGGGAVRPFFVDNPGTTIDVTIAGLTVTGGNGNSGGPTPAIGEGGGIRTNNERLTLDGVVVTGNTAGATRDGGGVAAASEGSFVTIRNSTISGNTARRGGGISLFSSAGLLLENSTVSGNTSTGTTQTGSGGGGVYFFGSGAGSDVTVRNSTISGNTAAASGGGLVLRNFYTGSVLIQNSTITGNAANTTSTAAGEGGGGIALNRGNANTRLTIESTIVSGNTSGNGRDDVATIAAATVNVNFSAIGDADGFTPSLTSGNNLPFGAALGLGTLANNGGPTQTIAFDISSPLRNAGSNPPARLTTDQRGPGFPRVVGTTPDIGAFELQPSGPVPQVTTVIVNAGQSNTAQRSRVTSIDVVFSKQVTFAGTVPAAFTLSRIGGGAVGGFTATATVVGGVTVVTLSNFTGTETDFGSLADGRFQLTVRANQVTAGGLQLDGDGNGTGGDDFVQNGSVAVNGLFRLFGDVNADGVINAFDFAQLRNAFGSATGQAAYRDFLDFNGDGVINAFDFGQLRNRFGGSVP